MGNNEEEGIHNNNNHYRHHHHRYNKWVVINPIILSVSVSIEL